MNTVMLLIIFALFTQTHASEMRTRPATPANPSAPGILFTDNSLVTVSMLRGDAWIIRDQATYYAQVGDILHPGDILHTRENGHAKIISEHGVLINLSAHAHLKIHHDNEFEFLYGRFRLHSQSPHKIWLRTNALIAWPEQGQLAIDVFQQGAKLKTELAVIAGKVFISPLDTADKTTSYKIDPGTMWDSFRFDGQNPAPALSQLPDHVQKKMVSDRMNRYSGHFLFDLIYPDNPFPASLGPRYELGLPRQKEKLLPRGLLKQRDRQFLDRGLNEDTRIQGRQVVWYPRGFDDFITDLRPYVRPHQREKYIDEFWDQKLVRPLSEYERRSLLEE